MSRSYSDPSYGARKSIKIGPTESLATESNAADTTVLRYTFMYPCKVVDWNVEMISGGTDLTAATSWILNKSLGGTGTVAAFGTADMLAATATHTDAVVVDAAVTETSFVAGDDAILQLEGTTDGDAMKIALNLEVQEVFVESDS